MSTISLRDESLIDRFAGRLPLLLLWLAAALLAVLLLLPLGALLIGSVRDEAGQWSLVRFVEFWNAPGIPSAIANTLRIGLAVTAITVPLAFLYAYALQRACLPGRALWRTLGLAPLLGPSLVGALAFIQWFGNQGPLKSWLLGNSVYGPIGIVLATVFAAFPHAFMILTVALGTADARLYEAADSMGASRWRKFVTITLPSAKYGLISAAMVVFAYAISDFGIPKVIGGNYQVLAVEIYIQAVGLQNFGRGAVVALVLLLPVLFAFIVDWQLQRRQQAGLSARSVPYTPRPDRRRDWPLFAFCLAMGLAMLAVLGMAAYTSLVRFWPYNLEMSFDHYLFGLGEAGVLEAYTNSLKMALLTALCGTPLIFFAAWLLDKTPAGSGPVGAGIRAMAALPMGVPGLVLGIGYILFFNHPDNPLNGLYHTLTIMVAANVVHYYTSCHLTALTALKSLDREFEAVSASLKVSPFVTLWRVTLPVCLPAVLEIARYLFINAMTTVSALVFIYSPQTLPASVSILNLDEAGELGAAAAMATLIVLTTAGASLAYSLITHLLFKRRQAWRGLHR